MLPSTFFYSTSIFYSSSGRRSLLPTSLRILWSFFDSHLVTFARPLKLHFQTRTLKAWTLASLEKRRTGNFLTSSALSLARWKRAINLWLWSQGFTIDFVEATHKRQSFWNSVWLGRRSSWMICWEPLLLGGDVLILRSP